MPTAFGEMDIIDKILGGTVEDREKTRTSYLDEITRVAESDRAEKAPGGYEAGPNTSPEETAPDIPIAVPGFNSDGTPVGGNTTTTSGKVGAADADIVEDAVRPFDIKAIADKYGNPQGGGYTGPDTGSIFTEKEISKKDSKGLIKRGFVENAEGKRVYIYAKEPEKEKEGSADTASNPREVAYNAIIKQVEKYHGITDLRKFNVVTETKSAMGKLKDEQWNWTFGANTRMEDLTGEQRKHWDGVMRELYTRTYNEIAERAKLARADADKLMGMYEKNKEKWKTLPENAGGIWNPETAEIRRFGQGKEKRLPEGVAKDVETSIASFFKPVASQGMEGVEVKTEDVINKLDANHKALYNELRQDAYRLLRENPGLSGFEAAQKAAEKKGWWTEADTDEAKTMKVWRPPQGTKGASKATVAPPKGFTPAPGKFKNGKQVYVSPDGKKGWVAP